ncbi:hypothetical protein A3Q56_05579 [Intoshia linei]|uniref:Uncharacterized protein n=1 Tax=Intoshia linei TaxID=1819745 RepID=A0A177AXJ8_9BILA|nr:hypothetical protein A3Q56_05579 [Intoshia linei]
MKKFSEKFKNRVEVDWFTYTESSNNFKRLSNTFKKIPYLNNNNIQINVPIQFNEKLDNCKKRSQLKKRLLDTDESRTWSMRLFWKSKQPNSTYYNEFSMKNRSNASIDCNKRYKNKLPDIHQSINGFDKIGMQYDRYEYFQKIPTELLAVSQQKSKTNCWNYSNNFNEQGCAMDWSPFLVLTKILKSKTFLTISAYTIHLIKVYFMKINLINFKSSLLKFAKYNEKVLKRLSHVKLEKTLCNENVDKVDPFDFDTNYCIISKLNLTLKNVQYRHEIVEILPKLCKMSALLPQESYLTTLNHAIDVVHKIKSIKIDSKPLLTMVQHQMYLRQDDEKIDETVSVPIKIKDRMEDGYYVYNGQY